MERFVAYYEGKAIARARTFEGLVKMRRVKFLLEKKEFIIRHVTPGGAKVIYRGGSDKAP